MSIQSHLSSSLIWEDRAAHEILSMEFSSQDLHSQRQPQAVDAESADEQMKRLRIEARKNGNSGKTQTAEDDRFVKTKSLVVGWIRWVVAIRPPTQGARLRQTCRIRWVQGILPHTQGARLRQTCWIHFVSGEQLYVMALCTTQLLIVSARLAHVELGFREVLKFFVHHVFHLVASFHQFYLNQIQD
jgi:hypothetical protein